MIHATSEHVNSSWRRRLKRRSPRRCALDLSRAGGRLGLDLRVAFKGGCLRLIL